MGSRSAALSATSSSRRCTATAVSYTHLDVYKRQATEIEDSRVLVVDPGFFSVDWVLISNGELRRQSCGTSLEASSVILDEAVRLIAQDFGGNVGRERLEHTLRKGHPQVRLLGERVEVAPYLKKAADKVGPIVTTLSLIHI